MKTIKLTETNQKEVKKPIDRGLNLEQGDMSPKAVQRSYGAFREVLSPQQAVERIVKEVRTDGDKALLKYTFKLDGADLGQSGIKVKDEEIRQAYEKVEPKIIEAIDMAKANIEDFHKRQLPKSWFKTGDDGVILGEKYTPVESAGIYIPGGTAKYPSSVLMNAVPAKVAGVRRIVMVTPPTKDAFVVCFGGSR